MLGDTPNEDDDREPTAPIANDPYQAPALGESDGEEGLKDPTPKDTPEDETQEPDVAEVEEVQDDELLTRQQQREMRNAQANKKLVRMKVIRVKVVRVKVEVEVEAGEVEVQGRLLLLKIFRRQR